MKISNICDKCYTTNEFEYEIPVMGLTISNSPHRHIADNIKIFTATDTKVFQAKCKDCGNPFYIKLVCEIKQEAGNALNSVEVESL